MILLDYFIEFFKNNSKSDFKEMDNLESILEALYKIMKNLIETNFVDLDNMNVLLPYTKVFR